MSERPLRIVVADDEPDIRLLVARVLRAEARRLGGLEVLEAGSAAEALAHLERAPVDVLLTDQRMPGRDGSQLLAEVAERWPDTRRALMTGDHDLLESGPEEAGAHALVAKPWDMAQFLVTMRKLLQQGGQ